MINVIAETLAIGACSYAAIFPVQSDARRKGIRPGELRSWSPEPRFQPAECRNVSGLSMRSRMRPASALSFAPLPVLREGFDSIENPPPERSRQLAAFRHNWSAFW